MTIAPGRSAVRPAVLATAAALSVALAGCGSGSSGGSAPPLPSRKLGVAISGYAYHPAAVTVPRGTSVTFTNDDQTAHTATSTGSGFDTGTLRPGQRATVRLSKPGTYTYYCQFHAFMRATIVVR